MHRRKDREKFPEMSAKTKQLCYKQHVCWQMFVTE